MRRDSLFYALFQQAPDLLFDLVDHAPQNAEGYRFESVGVKEPKFEIDGVFLPQKEPGVVYVCEVQFQEDSELYERLFGELFLYFYRNRQRFSNWQAVIIYPSRSTEQSETLPYQALLNSDQVHRIYLNELGDIDSLSIGIGLMVLTTLSEKQAPEVAQILIQRTQTQVAEPTQINRIIELITTIMVYRFTHLSRQEIKAMLGITEVTLQQTRFYQEVKAEGIEEGRELGRQEGRQEGQIAFVLMLLTQKIGVLPENCRSKIEALSPLQLETLVEALLNFTNQEELYDWLNAHTS